MAYHILKATWKSDHQGIRIRLQLGPQLQFAFILYIYIYSFFQEKQSKNKLSHRFSLFTRIRGIMLHLHKIKHRKINNNNREPTSILCHYVVLNPLTKQFHIMAKPNNPKTRDNFYAALAYDPSKSCHYKIVHFKVLMCSIFLIQRVEIGLLWHVSSKIMLLRLAGKNERLILKESYIDYLAQAIWLGLLFIKKGFFFFFWKEC